MAFFTQMIFKNFFVPFGFFLFTFFFFPTQIINRFAKMTMRFKSSCIYIHFQCVNIIKLCYLAQMEIFYLFHNRIWGI